MLFGYVKDAIEKCTKGLEPKKDKDYWNAQEKRYKDYTAQADLFSGSELQANMFENN